MARLSDSLALVERSEMVVELRAERDMHESPRTNDQRS
jgi:hypothetical protein